MATELDFALEICGGSHRRCGNRLESDKIILNLPT